MDNETELNQTKRAYFIGSAVLVLLILAGFVVYLKNGKKESRNVKNAVAVPDISPVSFPETGSFSVVSSSQTAQVGQVTKATIVANTGGKDLVGYDMLFSVPADRMTGLTAKSLLTDFQVFVKENDGFVTVTGIRGLSSTSSQILADTPLVELSFTPTVAGKLDLKVLSSVHNEVTKFVDTATQLFYPKVLSTEIIVR